nr:type II toxin-antitoxin system RelB/DinJ family antitoxin [Mammaliicoccus sp. Marseille-Q6498]
MATVPTQIHIDENVKNQANTLFNDLGIDMNTAVNIFLRQCLLSEGLPFNVVLPKYNDKTLEAMIEAKKISRDESVVSYNTMEDLKKALEE